MKWLRRLLCRLRRPRFATGGVVHGPRDPGDDSVPVLLSHGCVPPVYVKYLDCIDDDARRRVTQRLNAGLWHSRSRVARSEDNGGVA